MCKNVIEGVGNIRNDKKYIFILLCMIYISTIVMGCGKETVSKEESLDYTVVEAEDVPTELSKLIEDKKAGTLRLTFTTKDYTYIVAGYGTQKTSGFSIRVNDIYRGNDTIYADFTLVGPKASESVTEVETMPYIVIKIEKRDETIVFRM